MGISLDALGWEAHPSTSAKPETRELKAYFNDILEQLVQPLGRFQNALKFVMLYGTILARLPSS